MERRLAVILMADLVDYSRLMETDQAAAIAHVRALRENWLEPELARRGGDVLKRLGDGWLVAFGSTGEAIEAAMAVQQGLAGHPEIQLRIAGHLGEIASDGTDFYGTGINIAARLQAEAPPGGIMISGDLHRQLDARQADRFADAGSYTLRNIAHPVAGFQWRPAAPDAAVVDDVPAIAVEPVAATPESPEMREAAADLQEQLVHRLSQRTGIRVLALDTGAGDETGRTYLLRGRLRHGGDRVRLTLTLLLSSDGRAIWSERFEGDAGDLFGFCDDVVSRADNGLRLAINALDGERIADLPDDALSPSELRTRAAHQFYRTTIEGYERAAALMERAIRLDPDNPMSRAMWVEGRFWPAEARYETLPPDLADRLAAAADQAVRTAPRSDYALYVRTHVRASLHGDAEGARRDARRLRQLNPDYTLGLEADGISSLALGDYEAAIVALTDCVAGAGPDPFVPFYLYALAVSQLLSNRPADAARTIAEAIEIRRDCRAYRLLLAEAHARAGAAAEADKTRAAAARLPDRPDICAARLPIPDSDRARLPDLAPATAG